MTIFCSEGMQYDLMMTIFLLANATPYSLAISTQDNWSSIWSLKLMIFSK